MTSTTWTGSSGVRPGARQPDGSRSLSAGHKGWTNSVSGNPKNVAVKIKSHEKTQAQLDVSIAFVRWKAARATHWSRPRTGNRDRGDVLAEVFASDHKHCYDTRHDASDIAWVPQTRGDCDCHGDSFLALAAMQARFDPVLQDLLT